MRVGFVAALACAATGVFSAGAQAEGTCPNEALRQELRSGQLPDCRAYELVTPAFKDGANANIGFVSGDGLHVIGNALGSFAGTEGEPYNLLGGPVYEFSRTASGWVTTPLDPPASRFPALIFQDASRDLTRTLWELREASQSIHEGDLYVREPDARFVKVGPLVGSASGPPGGENFRLAEETFDNYTGASADLSRILISHRVGPSPYTLYEYAGTGVAGPELVGVNDEGKQISNCGTTLGGEKRNEGYNAISSNGERVLFTALSGAECLTPTVNELYARINRSETVDISEPSPLQCEECQTGHTKTPTPEKPAEFQGASEDGSKVFFTTEQELLPGQLKENLYEFDFARGAGHRIVLASKGSPEPMVLGVARVSEDGSHVYFVAKGMLTGENGEHNKPVAGKANLYVYERDSRFPGGHTTFVATLVTPLTGAELIAKEAELKAKQETCEAEAGTERFECERAVQEEYSAASIGDSEDWQTTDLRPVQATPDGRFLVFHSGSQVFEYDAKQEILVNVSMGHPVGIVEPNFGEEQGSRPTVAQSHLTVSSDGSYVLLVSETGLSEYHSAGSISNGNVYPISGADGKGASRIDASGNDVFFQSLQSLVASDLNSGEDTYDVRVNGGFPEPAGPVGCAGEACQGARSSVPLFGSPGSSTATGGGNLTPAAESKGAAIPKPLTRAQKLAKALKACKKQTRRRRATCEARARRKFGHLASKSRAKQSDGRHK